MTLTELNTYDTHNDKQIKHKSDLKKYKAGEEEAFKRNHKVAYTASEESGATLENKVYFTNSSWIGVGGANKEGKIPAVKNLTALEKDKFKNIPNTIEFNWQPKEKNSNKTNSNPVSLDDSVLNDLEKMVKEWGYVINGYKYGKGFPQQNKPLLINISNDPSDVIRDSTKWKKLG